MALRSAHCVKMIACGNRLLLVLCLVLCETDQTRALQGIPKTEGPSYPAINLDNTNHEISEGLFEGDIVLTPEQKLLLLQRKATTDLAKLWPKNSNGTVTVGYRFGDDIINRTKLMVAITHWEQNTCIRFNEVPSTEGNPHLIFVNSAGCTSYVGRILSMTTGQNVSLTSSCVDQVGPAVHEIGHALGFYHEQSRTDRDDYVKIMLSNVQSGMEHNFDKRETLNYGLPYDYYSVMHYGPKYFTSNNNDTIAALNPLAQPLMGNRVGLSFADKRLANSMYDCIKQWLTACSLNIDPCQHLGYTGPDCNCECPEGTKGAQCEELHDSYTDALIKMRTPYSESITTEGEVSTPGYPTPIQTRMKFAKVLVAPVCHNVKLTVTDFHVYLRGDNGHCSVDALNIRTSDTLGSGTQYCGTEIVPGTDFISETNTIVLDYFNYDYSSQSLASSFRGFNATIKHTPVAGCSVAPPSSTPTMEPPSTRTTEPPSTATTESLSTTTTTEPPSTTMEPPSTTTEPPSTTTTKPSSTTTTEPPPITTTKPTSTKTTEPPSTTTEPPSTTTTEPPSTTTTEPPSTTTTEPPSTTTTEPPSTTTTKPSSTTTTEPSPITTTKPTSTTTTESPSTTTEPPSTTTTEPPSTTTTEPPSTTTTEPPSTTTTEPTSTTTTEPPSTTTTEPLRVTFVNSGRIPLIKSSFCTGSCRLRGPTAAGYQELTSGWYPLCYWPGEFCNHHMETKEPRYLKVTATEINTGPRDAIVIKSLFNSQKSITSAQAGKSYVFPSTAVNINFRDSSWWFWRRYKLTINVLNSDCHQIVRVQPGGPGTLTKINYAADTVCEWWIQAPAGKQIKLNFTAFKVGLLDCSSDYLAIDTSGDKRYKTASRQYCGSNTPGSVTSTRGQLNVILNGLQGGSTGFTATYTVV